MNKLKLKTRLKILGSLVLAFLVVSYVTPRIFIADTTEINPDFISRVITLPQNLYASLPFVGGGRETDSATSSGGSTMDNIPIIGGIGEMIRRQNLDYKPIGTGVYAAEDPVTKEVIYKIEAGTVVKIYKEVINGREVTVYEPVK